MKTVVVFKSKYGSSRQYASWISEALQCKTEDANNIKLNELLAYDVIIYVGGLYASGVNGFNQIKKHFDVLQNKKLLLCMVGLTNPADQEKYKEVFLNNIPEQYRNAVKPFALRGDQLFSKMSGLHRLMMKMPKAMAEKVPMDQRTEDHKLLIENYGKDIHFVRQEAISEIVEYVKKL